MHFTAQLDVDVVALEAEDDVTCLFDLRRRHLLVLPQELRDGLSESWLCTFWIGREVEEEVAFAAGIDMTKTHADLRALPPVSRRLPGLPTRNEKPSDKCRFREPLAG